MNKGYLLDTHIFIWWMEKDKRLPKEVFDLLRNPRNNVFLSVVNAWEIVIKVTRKKLKVPKNIERGILASGFRILPIELRHVLAIKRLPLHHKDPFDRMLIVQAIVEHLTLVTDDAKIKKYDVRVLE